jgi:hypothetical protein
VEEDFSVDAEKLDGGEEDFSVDAEKSGEAEKDIFLSVGGLQGGDEEQDAICLFFTPLRNSPISFLIITKFKRLELLLAILCLKRSIPFFLL